MRSLFPVSGLILATLPVVAAAEGLVAEAPANFAFIAFYTGEPVLRTLSNGTTEEIAPRRAFRIGVPELLDHLVELGVIPSRIGWRIVAVWADWPTSGKGYRYYLRRGNETRAIPANVLAFEPLDSATARKHTLSGDAIVGGSESYTSYATLKLSLSIGSGTANGLVTSSDAYRRDHRSGEIVYVPGFTKFSGTGLWEHTQPDHPNSVFDGRFFVGGSRIVHASSYEADLVAASGSSTVTAGNLQKSGTGALTLAGAGSLHASGSGQVYSGVNIPGGALNLTSANASFTASSLTLTSETSLVWSSGLLNGFHTINIAEGVTLQKEGVTVVTGTALVFTDGGFASFDLTAPPPGYVITDGVLTTTP